MGDVKLRMGSFGTDWHKGELIYSIQSLVYS